MRAYKQLTEDDRIEIYAMKQAGNQQKQIAAALGVSPSTISRELARNTGLRGYRPKQAQQKALYRRMAARKAVKMKPETIEYIESRLRQQHSPEQIAKRMKTDPHWQGPAVSHERIYQHIWQDKARGETLYTHLRIAGTKQRRKRRNSRDRRGTIKNRVGIEKRPPVVERKNRIGDWEGDTVVGKNHQGALVTLVDRKSKLTLIGKVDRYTAEAVERTIIALIGTLPRRTYTLTVDNGKEFSNHESIAHNLKIKVFFADPYSAWERGLNENTNGLIRQYVPKGSDIRMLTNQKIEHIMNRLNNRPRKSLGFLTPNEVFYKRKKLTG
ncbi:Transposase, IS30 family [Limihaloglobus sulfuriphilus]|uniref:Transposase, IS30 family n=1 Tax=Limihaloglobus sulfuriphilus TaxID=1851148 RepID=A0A1Q2MDH6_9BACT|nr:IS30 family transposase [Limihaloglobus sulfuriphilus]AQQ70756.1 Transposase, IS30 family [Limihaloglobus sulfuriphilus]